MSRKVSGTTKGLAPSELKRVQKLFQRRLPSDSLATLEYGREIYRAAQAIGRRIGVLVSREGEIEEVIVGSREILYIPPLGRSRLGKGRLRRLRLLFSDLSKKGEIAHIPKDIYTDLQKLRFDAVVSLREIGNELRCSYAHLVPFQAGSNDGTRTEQVRDLARFELDFLSFIEELEDELEADTPVSVNSNQTGAVLVGVYGSSERRPDESMAELYALAQTAGVNVAGQIVQRRNPDPRTLLGKGKLEEVVLECLRLGAELLIFDGELKPTQWRSIINSTELKVIDRSMLILDIFAQRASSSDGRLQVELAQLKYNLPRLVEKDAGLSRLSGGIGGRGPGETKLEIGRRRMRDRIAELEGKIDQLSASRTLRRSRRKEAGVPLVAILGYTNVGKSTLFNVLTSSKVLVENKLFATLDPAHRKLMVPRASGELMPIVLSDTVGFIRALPEELRNAFRATLEELYDASLLVHVIDASSPTRTEQAESVLKTLKDMVLNDTPIITVYNKIDGVKFEDRDEFTNQDGIMVSATKRIGLEQLRAAIGSELERIVVRQAAELAAAEVI